MTDRRQEPGMPVARSSPRSPRQFSANILTAIATLAMLILPLVGMLPAVPSAYASGAAGAGATDAPAPKAYVGLFKDNAVAVFDTGTNKVLRTIPVPPGPHGVVVTPDGSRVYVSSDGASTVSVIDTGTDTVINTIEVGQTPHGLAMTPNGKYVLVADFGTDQMVIIDTGTDQVVGQVPVPNPHNIAISPDSRTAYVGAQKPGSLGLVIVDIAAQTQTGVVPLDNVPRALNFSPDGKELYFTVAGVDAVQVLDPATNKVVTQIPVGVSPHHPLFTPKGDLALVVVQGPGQLALINPANNTVTGTVAIGKFPHWVAVSADGRTAWVTNETSGDVSVVDLGTQKVTATIPIGNGPRKIAVQPGPAASGMTGMAASTASASAVQQSAPNAGAAVSISNLAFAPATVTIAAGQTVVWTNNDPFPHTTTSDQAMWDSGSLDPGTSYSQTFNQPGTYTYHCSIHPFMHGTIVVK